MDKVGKALFELKQMDEMADKESTIHMLHPLAKLLVTLAFIITVVSFDKYDLTGMIILIFYPIILFQVSGIPIKTCFVKLRVVMPLVCAVGLFNPLFDRTVILQIGSVGVSGGVMSMITLMLKGILCLMASFLLVATTRIDALCAGLRKLHIPSMIVTLLLLTYRYVSVLTEEVAIMSEAYHLRAPGQRGIHYKAWGSFLGQLLLRSMDRAEELYASMLLRGFNGEFHYADGVRWTARNTVYAVVCVAVFVTVRIFNIAVIVGNTVVR